MEGDLTVKVKHLVVLIAAICLTFPPFAQADGVLCDAKYNQGISNNATHWPLAFQWLNTGHWYGSLDYIIKFKTGQGVEQLSEWHAGGTQAWQTWINDRFGTYGIQRGGYTFATYDIEQYSDGYTCNQG